MHTNGARYKTGHHDPKGTRTIPKFIETPEPAPTHDFLVMSHGPGTKPDEHTNHACLNSFTISSWIIAAGG